MTDEEYSEEDFEENAERLDIDTELATRFLEKVWDEYMVKPEWIGEILTFECPLCGETLYKVNPSEEMLEEDPLETEEAMYRGMSSPYVGDNLEKRYTETVDGELFDEEGDVEVCSDCLDDFFQKHAERQDVDEEVPVKLLRKLWEDHNINPKGLIIDRTWECGICDETHYLLEQNEAVPEDIGTCRICGWDECLSFNKWGERTHPEYVGDRFVLFGENTGEQICYACEENFGYHPDGTVILHSQTGETFKGTYVDNYLQDAGTYSREHIPFHDLPEEEQEMVREIVEGTYYHSTDAWRGHHDIDTEGGYAVKVHGDCILAMSEDAKNLKKFDEAFKEVMARLSIPFARTTTTTSNVCSSGYDVFVLAEKSEKAKEVAEKLDDFYRSDVEFSHTAFSGESPASSKNKISVEKAIEEVMA